MRDRPLILTGLALFVAALTWPTWRMATGTGPGAAQAGTSAPVLAKATRGPLCVAPVVDMRTSHMRLLADWRDRAVRAGDRRYTTADGRSMEVSLTGTCLGCHDRKAEFCDRCHDYAGVKPDCWNCHVVPGSRSTQSAESTPSTTPGGGR